MILVMWKQIIWPQTIKVTAARAQLCKYDVECNRMPIIK